MNATVPLQLCGITSSGTTDCDVSFILLGLIHFSPIIHNSLLIR